MTVSWKAFKDRILTITLFLPALVLVGYFVYFSIGWNIVVSLSDWKGLVPSYRIVGFSQYLKLISDPVFLISLKNNLILMALFVPGSLILGLFLAILLDQKVRFEGSFRAIYLLPFTLSFVITGYLWRWMYNPTIGVINTILDKTGLGFLKSGWITDPNIALYCVVLALIWQFAGYTMLIFLAGIRSIPESHIMAAQVDGASGIYLYRRIIIPQIKFSFFTAFVILMVFALKAFDFIYILTSGGPGYATEILPLTMYKESFAMTHFAYGSAIASLLFFLVMMIVVPYLLRTYWRKEK
ncbi:MAG: sugar ABC transporter permease [Coprothermobacterota bacterium]|nr:sugar ABC transporter permease [Coprothermobacterota bacterium]